MAQRLAGTLDKTNASSSTSAKGSTGLSGTATPVCRSVAQLVRSEGDLKNARRSRIPANRSASIYAVSEIARLMNSNIVSPICVAGSLRVAIRPTQPANVHSMSARSACPPSKASTGATVTPS